MSPTKPKTFNHQQTAANKRHARANKGIYHTAWWQDTRIRIAVRDGYQCTECGDMVGIEKGDFHCDHDDERPPGAPINTDQWDSDANLKTKCERCHNRKTRRRGA